jgi:hypothetical protein
MKVTAAFFVVSPCELQMWASKLHPIVEKSLQLHFTVDPVGNQLM